MSKEATENDKRKRNNLLSQYYGITEEKDAENLFDVDGKHFNADAYVDKLVQVNRVVFFQASRFLVMVYSNIFFFY